MKRIYFECTNEQLRDCDVWNICVPFFCHVVGIGLADDVASKVHVRSVMARNFELLAIPDSGVVPGPIFKGGIGMGRLQLRTNDSLAIKFLKLAPMTVADCVRFVEDGEERFGLGWIDVQP